MSPQPCLSTHVSTAVCIEIAIRGNGMVIQCNFFSSIYRTEQIEELLLYPIDKGNF